MAVTTRAAQARMIAVITTYLLGCPSVHGGIAACPGDACPRRLNRGFPS